MLFAIVNVDRHKVIKASTVRTQVDVKHITLMLVDINIDVSELLSQQ